MTRGPVTLDVNGKNASDLTITVKGIQLTVTGTGTIWGVTASGSSAVVKNSTVKINYITAENGGRLELGGGSYMGLTVKNDGSSASLSGGTYKKIEWGKFYVPANEYLADGYGYKTSDGTWEDGTASVDNVTVTPAPIKSTKVYPNSETDYSGSTFDAKDSTSVTLTVSVTFDESAGLTYTWYRFIDDEWCSLTNSYITQGLTEKYTGADSQTLSITELPAGQTFSYKVQIATGDGYKCFSKPFTVSTCAHDGDKTLQHDETHHWYVCGKCGAELDRAEHSGGTATCTAKAVCSICQTAYGELGGHTLTKHDAVDATCTAPGNVEYWHCSVCGKNFSDSAGTGELTEITSPALNHNWGAWEKVSETQHQRICQNDGSHKETGDHTPGTAATCKAPANCSICGQSYGEKNPSNHTGGTEVRNQKEATTTTEGYTGDTYCLGCGEKIASGTVIPKLPSSGGGSSSGGGGGSSTPSVSVPVSSDHGGTKLSATISGSTATVSVSGKEIDKVIADGAKSVTVDLSGLSKVDSVKLPASVIAKTEDAEDTGLTIRLPDGAVGLDEAALESIASGKTVTVSVQQANLTDAQQEAVSSLAQVAVVVDVDIVVGTVKQSAFNGGRLTISIPYIPEKGEDTSTLAVWYIRDDGSIENKGGSYDAKSGCFVFETDHLSRYLLVHTEQVMGFTDVPANSWYAGAVAWAVEQGITSGTSDTTFSPNVSCTRAQMVTFLWRASGTPEIGTTSPFSDVSADAYYYDAVLWAVEQGITGGTGGGKFSPDTPCTRAQMATFLWRANGSTEVTGTTPFSDVSAETYYYNAVLWAYEQNITNGTGGGKFSPDAPCTRAQMVQMLKNASDAA